MNKLLLHAPFVVGLLVVAWVGAGYLPDNPLALALVALIGAFFGLGALELHRFQQASAGLAAALDATREPPASLGDWLARLPAGLRPAVRLRLEGERVGLPGPSLTPYLAGLLVLLGMLGTFLGMVVTLKGTGLALQNAADVEAIRASLAAPVKGLGLAFGCSVAGVAASASLGLMSALARRERQRVAQALDAAIAGPLRGFSRVHQREEALRLLQAQTDAVTTAMTTALPALAGQIEALVAQMGQQTQTLQDRLLAGQSAFHQDTQRAYTGLAESVGRSLQDSLAEGARLSAAALEPAVQSTLAGLARESAALHDTLGHAVQRQLDGITARLDVTTTALGERWQAALAQQQQQGERLTQGLHDGLQRFAGTFDERSATLVDGVARRLDASVGQWTAGFEQHAAALLRSVAEAHGALDAGAAARESERLAAFHDGLSGLAATVQREARDSADAVAARQQQICSALEQTAQAITAQAASHAHATIGEIARLVDTASLAPRAAAEVIGELRKALSDSLVRDNAALDERNRLLATLGGLLDAVNHASTEQRAAIDALVHASTDVLGRLGTQFAQTVDTGSRTLQAVSAQVSGSAAEVASLGEGFGTAVQLFSRASEQLMSQLQRIESALGQSMARSDEQLAYYVAQAREVIDLTLGSQKQVIDELQQLARAPAARSSPAEAPA